jgi:peptide/nickel transport system substrate-binding protein
MRPIRTFFLALLLAVAGVGLAQPVVVMQSADAATLDPTLNRETPTFNVLINVFDALLTKGADGDYHPGLATSWEVSDDGTVWDLELRDDVTFHDGTPFTAEAVVFTVERILDEATESPIRGGFTFIESVEATGEHAVRITTAQPTPLAEHYFSELLIVPPHVFEAEGAEAFGRSPVGTGPYRVTEWQRDVVLDLEAYQDHWRGAPDVAEVEFRPVPEAITRVSALQAGEADLVTQVPPNLAPVLESAPEVELAPVAGARAIYVGINVTGGHEALANPNVRRALNLAVDVEGIVEGILAGRATPTTTFLTGVDFGYSDAVSPYAYDPDRARELLAEAGWDEGLELTLQSPNGRYVGDAQVAQAVAEQLQQVGVDLNLEIREYGAYVGDLFSGNAPDLYLIGWGNAPLDADFILYPLLRTGELLSYYSDPALDALLDEGRSTVDRDERRAAYADALRRIDAQAPAIFLYKPQDLYGVSARLDWEPRTDERIWLYDASLE